MAILVVVPSDLEGVEQRGVTLSVSLDASETVLSLKERLKNLLVINVLVLF